MDITDILGGLLKNSVNRGGRGGDVLNDAFQKHRGGSSRSSKTITEADIDQYAKELEDVLNVGASSSPPSRRSTPAEPAPRDRNTGPRDRRSVPPDQRSVPPDQRSVPPDQRSLVLVRAMVNAAKADGRVDAKEQDAILSRLKNRSAENVQFLRDEFARPLDVRAFARSVPAGLEEQVYTLSLIAIDLDTSQEAKYLMALSEGLGLSPESRERIHQRLGAPSMY